MNDPNGEYRAVAADPEAVPRFPCANCQVGHDTIEEVWACPDNPDEVEAMSLDDIDRGGH